MKSLWIFAAVTLFSWTKLSVAIISVEAMTGSTTFELKNSALETKHDVKAQTLGVGLHLDPIPLVPISFGIQALLPVTTSNNDDAFPEYAGSDISAQIAAWSPIALWKITPFVKLGATIIGKAVTKANRTIAGVTTKVPVDYNTTGSHVSLGLRYGPIPFLNLVLEYQLATLTLKPTKDETDISGINSMNYKYKGTAASMLLGLEVRL